MLAWSSGATGAGLTNGGYGGSQVGNFNLLGTGETGSDRYLGFFVQHDLTSDYVAGWINFDFERTSSTRAFTINGWGFNVGNSDTFITMPANGGAAPVPGIGGLAGLATDALFIHRLGYRSTAKDRCDRRT